MNVFVIIKILFYASSNVELFWCISAFAARCSALGGICYSDLAVCVSVTLIFCAITTESIIMWPSRDCSPVILVSRTKYEPDSSGDPLIEGIKWYAMLEIRCAQASAKWYMWCLCASGITLTDACAWHLSEIAELLVYRIVTCCQNELTFTFTIFRVDSQTCPALSQVRLARCTTHRQ